MKEHQEAAVEAGPRGEVTAAALAGDPELSVVLRKVAGDSGMARPIRHPRVQKSGLALAGHFFGVVPTRVQVLGETELSYLDSLGGEQRSQAARGFFSLGLSCVVVTSNHEPGRALTTAAEATGTPLFVSEGRSSRTINAIHAVLDDRLAPQTSVHGVLVDVFGVGLLLLGKSGIGKSECALELVLRGHRLIADDIVKCEWRPPGIVFGAPADLLRHHIEVRGLGVLNIKALFGVTSVREKKRIDVVVRLDEWEAGAEYDRLGLDDDMGTILEIAARNELLRRAGTNSSLEFMGRLEQQLVTHAAVDSHADPNALFAGPAAPVPPAPGSSVPAESSRVSWTGSNESSAWIPAVRPKGSDE